MTPAKPSALKPPAHLSSASKRWWAHVVDGWDGLEVHHLHLLRLACEALDRAEAARRILDRRGVTYTDRFGAPRRHPCVSIESESRAAFGRLVRQLNLDEVEPKFPRNQWRRPKPRG